MARARDIEAAIKKVDNFLATHVSFGRKVRSGDFWGITRTLVHTLGADCPAELVEMTASSFAVGREWSANNTIKRFEKATASLRI